MKFTSLKDHIQQLVVEANGQVAVCIRTDEGEIFINETVQMKAASVIKIPIVMAALDQHDQGKLDIYQTLIPSETVGGCGVLHYFTENDPVSLVNIMKLAIIVSDNTASNMVIDAVGLEQINQYINKVGATGTTLARHFFDDRAAARGLENVTTAKDMLLFLNVIDEENDYLSTKSRAFLLETLSEQQLKNKLPFYRSAFPDADIKIAHKTGEITGSEHDVGIIRYGEKKVYVAVLTSGWTYNYEAQQLVAQIGKYIMSYLVNS